MLRLRLFGMFRKHGRELELTLPREFTQDEFRQWLSEHHGFDRRALAESAFANEDQVLSAHAPVPQQGVLAVLPPVCGG